MPSCVAPHVGHRQVHSRVPADRIRILGRDQPQGTTHQGGVAAHADAMLQDRPARLGDCNSQSGICEPPAQPVVLCIAPVDQRVSGCAIRSKARTREAAARRRCVYREGFHQSSRPSRLSAPRPSCDGTERASAGIGVGNPVPLEADRKSTRTCAL
jgi:hypothetical protein